MDNESCKTCEAGAIIECTEHEADTRITFLEMRLRQETALKEAHERGLRDLGHVIDHQKEQIEFLNEVLNADATRISLLEAECERLRDIVVAFARQVVSDLGGIEREISEPRGQRIADWSSLANTRRWAQQLIDKYKE